LDYKEKEIPETRREKKIFWLDYANGRCCKLRLTGSSQQIEDILIFAEWNPRLNESWFSSIEEVTEQGEKYRFTFLDFSCKIISTWRVVEL